MSYIHNGDSIIKQAFWIGYEFTPDEQTTLLYHIHLQKDIPNDDVESIQYQMRVHSTPLPMELVKWQYRKFLITVPTNSQQWPMEFLWVIIGYKGDWEHFDKVQRYIKQQRNALCATFNLLYQPIE